VRKRPEVGAGAGAIKKESSGARATLMKANSSGGGTGAVHFYDGSTALNNPRCNRAHRQSRVKI